MVEDPVVLHDSPVKDSVFLNKYKDSPNINNPHNNTNFNNFKKLMNRVSIPCIM